MFETLQKYGAEFGPADPAKSKASARNYNAAQFNRLTNDWVAATSTTINQILRANLKTLRERSRDLAKNDPYAKKFLRLLQTNVVGRGIALQVKPSGRQIASDLKLSQTVEESFRRWGQKPTCSASGKLSWREIQQMFTRHLARDGEVLIRFIYDQRNPFGFSLKIYDGSWLDETYYDTRNGNRVVMSVEIDQFDRPVAYYLTQPVNDYPRSGVRQRFRVPAEEIIHAFIHEDEMQARGVPWMHAAMIRLKQFDGYEEAELVSKRVGACKMGILVPPADYAPADGEEPDYDLISEVEPGVLAMMPPEFDLKPFDPKDDQNAGEFKKTTLRGVAAGLDLSYHSLAGDLEAVNFSSARIGSLDERDVWRDLQAFVIENLCEPVYRRFLETAMLAGALQITARDMERVADPVFRGRGWSWVNPRDDAQAAVIGLENKFMTRTDILAERGIDFEDYCQTMKRETEIAARYGIDLTIPPKAPKTEPQDAETDAEDPAKEKK